MRRGFTLIEILVAMVIFAILTLAFVRFFSGTLRATGDLQVRNELLNEAQVALPLIASRVKEAWYVFPPGSRLRLTSSGWSAKNTLEGGYHWTVGPRFLAMILPPEQGGVRCSSDPSGCFRFFAYYPMKRSWYVHRANALEALDPDPTNDDKVWVIMEYRAYYRPGTNCPVTTGGKPNPSNLVYRGKRGRLLLDYVQPLNDPWDPSFNYPTLFSYTVSDGEVASVSLSLRSARQARGRVFRTPSSPGPLSLIAEPQNRGVLARRDGPYCR